MGVLWAPWRRKYVTAGARPPGCVLCRALEQADRPESLVVHVGPRDFVVMNLYPYNAGHVMIAPHRHVATLNTKAFGGFQVILESFLLTRQIPLLLLWFAVLRQR